MIINTTTIISALGLSFILHYLFHKICLKKNIIDIVNNRSSHRSLATRSGGLSIFITIFLVSFFYYIKGIAIYDYSILVSLSLLTVVGLYDDLYNIDFKLKFIFQIIAAKIIVDNGGINYGISSEITAKIFENISKKERSNLIIKRIGPLDNPVPSTRELAKYCYPSYLDIIRVSEKVLNIGIKNLSKYKSKLPSDQPNKTFMGPF